MLYFAEGRFFDVFSVPRTGVLLRECEPKNPLIYRSTSHPLYQAVTSNADGSTSTRIIVGPPVNPRATAELERNLNEHRQLLIDHGLLPKNASISAVLGPPIPLVARDYGGKFPRHYSVGVPFNALSRLWKDLTAFNMWNRLPSLPANADATGEWIKKGYA